MKYNKFQMYLHFCIGAFFLILAVTLYYSFGYKYDFLTGKSLQVGAIVLRTTPKDVIITKDSENLRQNGFLGGIFSDFIKIENLEPKSYNIKVSKDGYNDWQKNIEIKSGQVEKFETIVILKKDYKKQEVFEDIDFSAGRIWISAEENKMIFQGKIAAEEGLFIIDFQNETHRLMLDKEQLAITGEIRDIKWTEDDNKVVVKTPDNLYLLDTGDNGKAYLISSSVSEVLNKSFENPIYVFDKFLIFKNENAAYSFNYITKETTKIIEGISSLYVYQGSLYFFKIPVLTEVSSLFFMNLGDLSYSVRISSMPEGYDPTQLFTVRKDSNNYMVLGGDSLYLVGKNAKTEKINSNVKEARFFQGGKRILYTNDNEIWIYYVENKTSQPIKSKGDNELLTRFSGKLSNIYLYSDEEHLFFQENNMFKFTELDGRDNRNTFDLIDNASGKEVLYLRGKNLLYYMNDNKFYKIDLAEV